MPAAQSKEPTRTTERSSLTETEPDLRADDEVLGTFAAFDKCKATGYIEKAFGVKMDTLMRMQSSYDIAQTRKREHQIKVPMLWTTIA